MTPDEAIQRATEGDLPPVIVVIGEEAFEQSRVQAAIRTAAEAGGLPEFNTTLFTAGETSADRVLDACRMVPMMAPRRFIAVRGLERWDGKDTAKGAQALEALAEYAKEPCDTAVLLLCGDKVNKSRKLVAGAKKGGYLVECNALPRGDLPAWIVRRAKGKGVAIGAADADALAELAGPELSSVEDALERLALYCGPGNTIDEAALAAVVTRIRPTTVWQFVDAISDRALGPALAHLQDVFDSRDGGLRLVGAVGWSVRQLIKFDSAMRSGARPNDAAARAGIAPFKVRRVQATVRKLPPGELGRWAQLLGETDIALKSSRLPARAALESMVARMCEPS